jgi:hypothetical protein
MPADTNPATAGSNNDLIIEIEHHNCSLTNRCQSNETYPGRIPGEVVCPCVLAWVKDGDHFARKRMAYSGRGPFEFIATTAGKTEIAKFGLTTLDFGDDMVYHHGLTGIGLDCLTVGATMVVCFHQSVAQFGR